MTRWVLLFLVVGSLWSTGQAHAQQVDFGRFRLGMTPAEARAASSEQRWTERSFGADLIILTAERPIRIGQLNFQPMLGFRDGRLSDVQFQGGGPIERRDQCDAPMMQTVAALESSLGAINVGLAPGEFGVVAQTRTTAGGSVVRFYETDEIRNGFAVQRGQRYIQVASLAGEFPSMGLGCLLEITMRPQLGDFEPLLPPTAAELAAAQEVEPEWAIIGGPEVTELTIPPARFGQIGRVRVRLDCLVIAEQRLNCAIESEEPQGMQFGEGALAQSRFYRIEPMINGESTEGKRVRFTVRYDLGQGPER
ncbi:MAG: hypothetical protein ACK4X1_07540 [Terricaulis sp.]